MGEGHEVAMKMIREAVQKRNKNQEENPMPRRLRLRNCGIVDLYRPLRGDFPLETFHYPRPCTGKPRNHVDSRNFECCATVDTETVHVYF
jgi:hypothetical protein